MSDLHVQLPLLLPPTPPTLSPRANCRHCHLHLLLRHQERVEGSVVHIMKALASHTTAAQSLIEDNLPQLLFQMVANGSLTVFAQYQECLVPLHTIQLHRHAMQILNLLLVNDNGSTAKYIRKHLVTTFGRSC